jgi:high-affinity Fe2+/Pb2+ permease
VLLIIREGFEIALFTATTSLFSRFIENFAGLFVGFICSAVIGTITFFIYSRFPIGKVYKYTEYLIVLLGAGLVKNGLTELAEIYFHINLSDLLPIKLFFLPNSSTYIGHFLNTLLGVEQNFSIMKLAIMVGYIAIIYHMFLKKPHLVSHTS